MSSEEEEVIVIEITIGPREIILGVILIAIATGLAYAYYESIQPKLDLKILSTSNLYRGGLLAIEVKSLKGERDITIKLVKANNTISIAKVHVKEGETVKVYFYLREAGTYNIIATTPGHKETKEITVKNYP